MTYAESLERDQYIDEGIRLLEKLQNPRFMIWSDPDFLVGPSDEVSRKQQAWFEVEQRSRIKGLGTVIVGTPHDSRAVSLKEIFDRGNITGDEYEAALHAWPLPRSEEA